MTVLPLRDDRPADPPPLRLVPACTLLKSFKPIESIVDGLPVGRGALVSITGPTGAGKTTISALLEASLCRGLPFAGREVTQGSVLVLAGENPDDYAMHLAATVQHLGLYPEDMSRCKPMGELLIVPGTFDIDLELDRLRDELSRLHVHLVAVVVDTSAAFYLAGDENDNVAMRQHASRLRELATLPGKPSVLVLCHPTKTAIRDGLLPRGGGAFLAEVDANLTLWKEASGIVSLHWAGKIRGPSFDPIRFELVPVQLDGVKDCRGRPIFSVAARHVPDDVAERIEEKALDDENRLLQAMQRKPGGSISELCVAGGFTLNMGAPNKSKAARLLGKLADQGLVEKDRTNTWRLTGSGRKAAAALP